MFLFGGKGDSKGPMGFFGGGDSEPADDDDEPSGQVDNSRFYELLDVPRDASAADIKKAYRMQAMKHHPDKGGDSETFKDIQRAFEVLSDTDKRQRYDRLGEGGLEGDAPGSPSDLFSQLFGGKGSGKGRGGRPRTRDVARMIWVSLEELYSGVTRTLPITRKVIDEEGGSSTCQECDGQGVVIQVIRMGHMVQQMQQACTKCAGSGTAVKTRTVSEVLEVFVEKGSPDGHKIQLHGKADEAPGSDPGDVVVVVREKDHPRFMRKGADLYMEQDISLAEALTGFRIVVTHLDGRKVVVRSKPGEVLQPSKGGIICKAVAGCGMPIHQDPFRFGNLFLVLSIRFPVAVDPKVADDLRRLLGAPPQAAEAQDEGDEDAVLEDIDPLESSKQNVKVNDQAYDEDEQSGMQRVQCAQQ